MEELAIIPTPLDKEVLPPLSPKQEAPALSTADRKRLFQQLSAQAAKLSRAAKKGSVEDARKALAMLRQLEADAGTQSEESSALGALDEALEIACSNDRLELVRYLIANGADCAAPIGHTGSFAIVIAAKSGSLSVMEFMAKECNIDISIRTPNHGSTLLHLVAEASEANQQKYVECCQWLLEYIDVNVTRPIDGATPLHIASNHGRDKVVKTLLDAGADYSATCNNLLRDGATHTALQLAEKKCKKLTVRINSFSRIVQLLRAAGKDCAIQSPDGEKVVPSPKRRSFRRRGSFSKSNKVDLASGAPETVQPEVSESVVDKDCASTASSKVPDSRDSESGTTMIHPPTRLDRRRNSTGSAPTGIHEFLSGRQGRYVQDWGKKGKQRKHTAKQGAKQNPEDSTDTKASVESTPFLRSHFADRTVEMIGSKAVPEHESTFNENAVVPFADADTEDELPPTFKIHERIFLADNSEKDKEFSDDVGRRSSSPKRRLMRPPEAPRVHGSPSRVRARSSSASASLSLKDAREAAMARRSSRQSRVEKGRAHTTEGDVVSTSSSWHDESTNSKQHPKSARSASSASSLDSSRHRRVRKGSASSAYSRSSSAHSQGGSTGKRGTSASESLFSDSSDSSDDDTQLLSQSDGLVLAARRRSLSTSAVPQSNMIRKHSRDGSQSKSSHTDSINADQNLSDKNRILANRKERRRRSVSARSTGSGERPATSKSTTAKSASMEKLHKELFDTEACALCKKICDIQLCVQCLSVGYCSRECQKLDWPSHKAECRNLNTDC